MMQRSVSIRAILLALFLVSKVHSFAPSSPLLAVSVLPHRCASSVQVQTLSDESAATEQAAEAPVADVAPLVILESAAVVEEEPASGPADAEASSSTNVELSAPATKRKVERARHTAFVGNLPYETTEANIRDMFAAYGTVQLVNLPKDRITGTLRGFAFVDMATDSELDAAIAALNSSSIGDREIRVQKSQPADKMKKPNKDFSTAGQKLYVGNLPFDITKEEVLEFFGQYAEIMDVFVPKNDEGTGRGYVFITVKIEDTEKVIEATNNFEFEGRTIVVSKPLPPGQKAPPRTYPTRKKIYVGNLSFDTISETIESLFGEFGEVYDCFLPTDMESGNSRGFGFVTMGAEAADVAILELDGCEVDGRVIRVNAAMEKKDVSYTMKSNEGSYD